MLNYNRQQNGCMRTVKEHNLEMIRLVFRTEIYLGIIVHFEDTLLSNYYFLDPQYLAEVLAQLIATEQTNGLARHGEF